jgi:hypothetical protein
VEVERDEARQVAGRIQVDLDEALALAADAEYRLTAARGVAADAERRLELAREETGALQCRLTELESWQRDLTSRGSWRRLRWALLGR